MPKFLLALTLLFGCTKAPPSPPQAPIQVTAFRAEAKSIPANFEYIGVAESSHIVELRARVEGYLEKIAYKEGALVQTGDLMFVIDERPFIAEVDKAKGELKRQEALLWNAEQSKNRMVPLYKQNAVSQRDLDNAIAEELAAAANVLSAKATLYHSELNLSFARLTAPVTGLASQAKYREGSLISQAGENLLTTLYVVDPIWINFSVSERDLLISRRNRAKGVLLWPDKMNFQIEAILADGTVVPTEGFIDFTNPALQQSTGTMLVRAVLPNPNLLLLPGQFVRVIAKGATYPQAIAIPQTAVLQGAQGMFVFVIEAGKVREQIVTILDSFENSWIIQEGLKSGDIVVSEGVSKLRDGSAVTIQELKS